MSPSRTSRLSSITNTIILFVITSSALEEPACPPLTLVMTWNRQIEGNSHGCKSYSRGEDFPLPSISPAKGGLHSDVHKGIPSQSDYASSGVQKGIRSSTEAYTFRWSKGYTGG